MALSLSFIAKSLGGIIMKTSITQIERRFDISSSVAGLIDGSFEIGNLLVIVFVSYFGSKLHRPRIIGIGCIVMGTGSILTALPHFFMGYYRFSKEITNPSLNSTSSLSTCLINQPLLLDRTSPDIVGNDCVKESGSYMWIYVLMGNLLRGIGETPIGPLGVSYIDDFAKDGHSSFYVGSLNAIAMIGPAIGFFLGSQFAKLYVDIGYVDLSSVHITPKDSRWVGAWWLGFLVAGLFAIVSSIPFFFLPKNLNEPQIERKVSISSQASKTNKEMKLRSKSTNYEQTVTGNIFCTVIFFTGFLKSLKSILTTPLYIIFVGITLFSFSSFIGGITYIFKFIEQQFGQSTADANFWIGLLSMPTLSSGFLIGGYIIKKFKLSVVGIAKLSFFSFLLAFILQTFYFLLICETKSVAGLTLTYDGKTPVASHKNVPLSYCNSDCNCDETQWEPLCGENGITYVSPCLAGCKSSSSKKTKMPKVFYNCSCVDITGFQNRNNSAHLGECPRSDHCVKNFYLYLALTALVTLSSGLGSTPTIMLIFKNVQPELKSLALGFHSLTIRSLGGILAPIYFGALIDRACLKWSISNCGKQGTCRIYDNKLFANYFLGITLTLKISSIILFIIFLFIMMKKYQRKDTKTSEKKEKVVIEANLEPLNNNGHFISSAGEDDETSI
ncbi:PREDICTED: solute carrier organic anion transporter family member 1B3 [Chrysochloris asiatica]|uniref:Solute carrier organic anion transporter family member n=1 Tax=Chrysochloris asiatica TaxID=185453 RepID=A0A9B0TMV6_CHRAS|nr:PREDICTED: solute carrier organic anion transporter family member 1B3 [Chrysochloris asiatica]